jgi:hypothetical protein
MNNLETLQTYHFDNKFRLGANSDGGYVLGELVDNNYDCYISAGISDEESFSRDFINKYNMNKSNSFGFDGTIVDYPYQYTDKISFIKKNINNFNDDNNNNLTLLLDTYNNIFLKMDIEGGEYPWLLAMSEDQLSKFTQIVIEFHGLTNDGWGCTYNDKVTCLEKLARTHYIIHAHGNNHSPVINGIPDVIELTYINKNYFKTKPELNKMLLPSTLDYPNNKNTSDINLNIYPFVKLEYVTTIFIGNNTNSYKIIDITSKLALNEKYYFILVKTDYQDTFSFTLKKNYLIVKRLDTESGWGYDHSVNVYK